MEEEEEEAKRAEVRSRAKAELEEFHAARRLEIEEQKRQNRERNAVRSGSQRAGPENGMANMAAMFAGMFPSSQGSAGAAETGNVQALLRGICPDGSASAGTNGPPLHLLQAALGEDAGSGDSPAMSMDMLQAAMESMKTSQGSRQDPGALGQGSGGDSAGIGQFCAGLAVRVREGEDVGQGFRRVVLRSADAKVSELNFDEVEKRISAKFKSTRGLDGEEIGLRRIVSLVRISDKLQIGDDEDVALFREGDELQATFAEPFAVR